MSTLDSSSLCCCSQSKTNGCCLRFHRIVSLPSPCLLKTVFQVHLTIDSCLRFSSSQSRKHVESAFMAGHWEKRRQQPLISIWLHFKIHSSALKSDHTVKMEVGFITSEEDVKSWSVWLHGGKHIVPPDAHASAVIYSRCRLTTVDRLKSVNVS